MTFRATINGTPATVEIDDAELARFAPKRMVKVAEVAEAVGQSTRTIGEWTKRQIIPSTKIGRNRRYDLDAVITALRARGECKAKPVLR